MNRLFIIIKNEDGWTFIETIIVIGIVLILSAGVGVMASKQLDRAKIAAVKSQMSNFRIALEMYNQDCNRYPTEEQGLEALQNRPLLHPVSKGWDGPYLDKELPLDPWDETYIYSNPGENGLPYSITSTGSGEEINSYD